MYNMYTQGKIQELTQKILDEKLIVIVRGMAEDEILPLAEALYAGGIRLIEVTFNLSDTGSYPATARAIQAISKRFGMDMPVGAGTVVLAEQVDMAYEAGAGFIISPNAASEVISRTKDRGLISMPGALTPGECQSAHMAGADFIKLFPAGEMGAGYLKAVAAPLSHLRFLAVGGINEKNIPAFIKAGASGFGVGGNLVNREWIKASEFNKITALARDYVDAVREGVRSDAP